MKTKTIFDELQKQFDLELSAKLEYFAETKQTLDSPHRKTRRLLRKAIVFSQQNPQLSIPNKGMYLFGNTELTERLEVAERSRPWDFEQFLLFAMEAIKLDLSPEERLEALISLGSSSDRLSHHQ